MFDFSIVTNWIHELLLSVMPEGLAIFIECVAVPGHIINYQSHKRCSRN